MRSKVGIIPNNISIPGNIGIVSRSGTLTYEVLYALKGAGKGASTCVGIGGDPVNGTNFIDVLEMFEADPHTDQVVMIGEIGGTDEERAADFISRQMTKPVVAFIAGQSAPPENAWGTPARSSRAAQGPPKDKIRALEAAGVRVARHPEEIPQLTAPED